MNSINKEEFEKIYGNCDGVFININQTETTYVDVKIVVDKLRDIVERNNFEIDASDKAGWYFNIALVQLIDELEKS